LAFFSQELPTLVLKITNVGLKAFSQGTFDPQKAYGHLSKKQQILLKMYSANFNKLLSQILDSLAKGGSSILGILLLSGNEVAKCCLPFSIYRKKLAWNCAKVIAMYAHMDANAQPLALQTLKNLVQWDMQSHKEGESAHELYEFAVKKTYNEFTKASRSGGGGF